MITQTREKIVSFINQKGQARVHDLVSELKISHVAVHKQVRKLMIDGLIEKRGTPPVVFYVPKKAAVQDTGSQDLPPSVRSIVDSNFLSITPDGQMLYGALGLTYWASIYGKGRPVPEIACEYASRVEESTKCATKEGLFDATPKLLATFPDSPIKKLFYADIYSIPVFGRTKLAKLVMHAKGAQDEKLVREIVEIISGKIEKLIESRHIQAVAFIPPTVPRPMQFMKEFEQALKIQLPVIEITKVVPGIVPVAQKSLTSTSERIVNARESMYPKSVSQLPYQHILLIDDVAGSGSSFNEVAKKIVPLCKKDTHITAFAIVGNQKGYDVIRQI